MFNLFTPKYSIEQLPNGRFGIFSRDGDIVNTYSRKRDAIRGAERQGLRFTVA